MLELQSDFQRTHHNCSCGEWRKRGQMGGDST